MLAYHCSFRDTGIKANQVDKWVYFNLWNKTSENPLNQQAQLQIIIINNQYAFYLVLSDWEHIKANLLTNCHCQVTLSNMYLKSLKARTWSSRVRLEQLAIWRCFLPTEISCLSADNGG